MSDSNHQPPSLLSRLLQDPIRLRRRSRVLAVIVGVLSALGGSGIVGPGPMAAALLAVSWLLVPVVAAGIGIGDAFFLRHGIGDRRVALTLVVGALVALLSCVALAVAATEDAGGDVLAAALYFTLVAGVIGMLSAGIAIAVGKAGGYLSRRIQNIDDTNW